MRTLITSLQPHPRVFADFSRLKSDAVVSSDLEILAVLIRVWLERRRG